MEDVSGKVAVVTGGASGIGLAMATRFAQEGMKVLLADIEMGALDDAAESLRADGFDVRTSVCDVSKADDMDSLGEEVIETFGAVHVVCNNAGVGSGGQLQSLTTKDWEWSLGVNLWGVIHGIRVFLPRLLEQNEGHIVNTASVAGLFASPFMGPYNAGKFAVVAISETMFNEFAMAGTNVGVSVLCPAWVNTKIHDSGRNRPEHLRNDDNPEAAVAATNMADVLKGVIENGMDPAEVAGQVLEAITAKRFYILTHENSKVAVKARMQAILDDGVPPFFMPQ